MTTTAPRRRHRTAPPRPIFGRRAVRSRMVRSVARHATLIAVLGIILYPLLWMLAASFRPENEIFTSLGLLSGNYTLDNYRQGWSGGQLEFSRYFLNSITITVLAVIGNIFGCSVTAYAFARLEFPFKRTLFAVVIGMLLLPYHVTLIPQYILFNELGWVNTILPLIVPRFLAVDAFFVFLMVQFIRGLPRDMDEAAHIDGCGHWGIFFRIVLPLSLPALGMTAMFTFVNTWNDFLGPLLYLNTPDRWTVAQGLGSFLDASGQSSYGALFAMASLSIAPIVGFFLVSQRLLIEGVATTGLK
ncbi:carbohydrate ABC transporter permease [Streptomonospora sediminis]